MEENKLFLLDAFALIYRAHFAFINTPRINSKGFNTSATFGFTNTLLEILQKEKPSHLAVAFDTDKPTFRHEAFEAYKAHRQEQPEDITSNIPFVMRMVEALGVKILTKDGYEADDIIGTLARKFGSNTCEVFMMTSDKDYCQLVNEHVFVYRPAFMGKGPEVYDVQKVLEKFQIQHVHQVTDILGLQGDSVDNIPGIPGIGEKTAIKLIAEYGSIENLIAQAEKLSGKLKENVVAFAQQGLQSKQLATIYTAVPLDITLEDLRWNGFRKDLLEPLLDELEFRQLKSKLLGTSTEPVSTKKIEKKTGQHAVQTNLFTDTKAHEKSDDSVRTDYSERSEATGMVVSDIFSSIKIYKTLKSREEIEALVSYLQQQPAFCFDTETTALDVRDAALVGISLAYIPNEAYYIPMPAERAACLEILAILQPVFESEQIRKVGHNLKFDVAVLRNYGMQVRGQLFDTMVAHYLMDSEKRHGMDTLAQSYLGYKPIPIETLIGEKGKNQLTMRDVPVEKIALYAAEDADVTWQLYRIFESEIKTLGMEPLFLEIECPLIYVLEGMERTGVCIDTEALKEISRILEKDIASTEQRIYELAGEEFLISSPKQLGVILFEKLKLIDKPKKTESGQYATGEEILSKLAEEHEIAQRILEYREYQKLKSTYVDALPTMIHPVSGRVHTSFNQTVAATGRLSSTNPNLQNIPVRTARGKEIRKAFVPQNDDFVLLSADYSQIELRIMADFSEDETMIEAFSRGVDIHSSTASKVFGVSLEAVDGDMRRKAKMINFGIIYGISAFGLSQRLGIARKEAQDIIEAYWKQFPKIKKYMERVVGKAREQGYVETLMKRRRYLRDINSKNLTLRGFAERNAINAPIQGTASDIIKKAMVDIFSYLHKGKYKSAMILQVHDELVFEVYKPELEHLMQMIPKLMVEALPLKHVPMEVSIGFGKNWLDAH